MEAVLPHRPVFSFWPRAFLMLLAGMPFLVAGQAWAGPPVAVVEQVQGAAGIAVMDMLAEGSHIQLGGGSATLDYIDSCVREVIVGGTVVVGAKQSAVSGGKVERNLANCAKAPASLSGSEIQQSGVVAFRRPDSNARPDRLVGSTQPVFRLVSAGSLVVERLDRGEPPRFFSESQGATIDLAALGMSLTPGKMYRASIGHRQMIFLVEPNAKPGDIGLIERLLVL